MTAMNAERAWQQVKAHDIYADGNFVYAVATTGVYCRPSCPSRRPQRQNVTFFPTPADASAAGYRACKRCRPDADHPAAARVQAACRYLDLPHEKAPTLRDVSGVVGMGASAFQRLFRRVLGVSPREYRAARQAQRFRRELGASVPVTLAIYEAGYGSPSRVYQDSAGKLGMTPGAYRKHGLGHTVRYTTAASSLGRILVAATERGVCAVSFGDSEEELTVGLQRQFARATLEKDDQALALSVAAVLAQMEDHPVGATLPLDVRATAFQWRVWQALRQIPRGETRSYAAIAQAIGQPAAVRAVARACGQNPVAVVIPCHRVIGKDGKLTGYRWGVERKRELLEREGAARRSLLLGPEGK
jgi:AraC family transcriptional regulator of adaptative response/methylated-DNA-[protein]-cysteine methyltransferase